MKYMICYDLRNKNKKEDYEKLYDELEELGAKRILYSQWMLDLSDTNVDELLRHFLKFLDSSDRLLVVALGKNSIIKVRNPITKGIKYHT